MLERIRAHHVNSEGNYGRIRILKDLHAEGLLVGHNRVARLMRKAGLVGVSRRKGCWTTRRDRDARPAPDLVERAFVASHEARYKLGFLVLLTRQRPGPPRALP